MKKNLLLIATGGTIASSPGEHGLKPAILAHELLEAVPDIHLDGNLDGILLMNIDSSNMQPEAWSEMARAVYEHYDSYDGFIITHGTDTMAYTSAALTYILQDLDKPVIVTGSMVPLNVENSDAPRNLADSVTFIKEGIGGVYIVFDGKVIMGTRAVKIRSKSAHAFESINSPVFATIEQETVRYNNAEDAKPRVRESTAKSVRLLDSLCPDVLLLKLYPGMKPELFDLIKPHYRGVIIESFGSGGIPMEERSLLPKLQELIEAGIAVVISTQCLEEGTDLSIYEVGKKMANLPIIYSGDMNTDAIVPKLMWALGQTDQLAEVKVYMETPIARDIQL
ncbi:asparaginase [Paenibacillus sp. GP183]|uniref:asparaginase n=1 Tax=Paenibacillus sp. GP183 TaxID=1882751 RepID=UPI000B8116DE|nr:asparaginase [Paenibacillus sp. GP183]